MAQVTVDYSVRLKVLQSSVDQLQGVLDKLAPNSAGFNKLNKVIQAMRREMEDFQVQTSRAFGSQQQFNKAEKTLEKMENDLVRAKNAMDGLKFTDIKLTDEQMRSFERLDQQLTEINRRVTEVKNNFRDSIISNGNNAGILLGIDPNILTKDFDTIVNRLNKAVERVNVEVYRAQQNLGIAQNNYQTRRDQISALTSTGISEQALGQDFFNRFFEVTRNGVTRFITRGFGRGEVKQQFLQALREEFQLTQRDINTLVAAVGAEDTFRNFNQAFINMGNPNSNVPNIFGNIVPALREELNRARTEVEAATRRQQEVQGVANQFNAGLAPDGAVTRVMGMATRELEENTAARKRNQQAMVDNVRTGASVISSQDQIRSAIRSLTEQLQTANVEFLHIEQTQRTFQSIKTAITNFMGFNQVLNLTKTAVKEALNHIKQLDSTMNGIAIVTDMTTEDLWKQIDTYSQIAQTYGTTIQGAYEVSKIYYQAGYETNDVLTLMNETLKLSKVSGLDYAKATDYMMTATRGFHMEVSEASKVVDVYSALAANTAVSQEELAVAMSKTASSMEGVGATFEEASSMIATMVAVTRESATNIGSALKSIASRYGELTKDPKALFDAEGDEMSFNKVDEALKSIGISLQTTDHQFRDFTDVILELSDVWNTLESAQQRYIATQFAGNRQQSRFLALVSNADLLRENMRVAEESEDTGTLQAIKALDSLESKLNQVQVAYQQFYTTIGAEQTWKIVLDGVRNFIDSLNSLPKLFGTIPHGAITVITDAVSLIKTGAINALATFAQEFNAQYKVQMQQLDINRERGQLQGREYGEGLVQGVREGAQQSDANVVTEALLSDENIQALKNKISNLREVISSEVVQLFGSLDWNNLGPSNPAELLEDFRSEFDPLIDKLITTGSISEKTAEELRKLVPPEALLKLQQLQNEAQNTHSQLNTIANIAKFTSNLSGIGMALNVVANALDKSSAAGKIFAGTLMTIGGLMKGVGEISKWMTTSGMAFPWLAVATAAITVVNGLATAIETEQEKLERLAKEAENLSNEAKRAKADYNTIQRTANKIDELKEKRYESIEAEKEYQTAVEELAEKVPNLIVGMDEAGEVIIETTSLEYELEKAREAAAQATLNAAKAERIKAEEELKQAEEKNQTDLEILTERNSLYNLSNSTNGGLNGNNFNISTLINEGKIDQEDWRDFISENGMSDWSEASLLNTLANKGIQGLVFDEKAEKTFISDLKIFKNSIASIEEFAEKGPLHEIALALVESQGEGSYSAIIQASSKIQSLEGLTGEEFKSELDKIIDFISSKKLNDYFEPFLNAVKEYNNGRIKIEGLKKALDSTKTIEISGRIHQLVSAEDDFFTSIGEGQSIINEWLNKQAKAYEEAGKGTYEDYIAANGQIEEDFELIKSSLDVDQWKKFGKLWKDRDLYSATDWRYIFADADEEFYNAIDTYYTNNGMDYAQRFADKIASMDADLPVDNLNLLLNDDVISKSLLQWLYSGLDTIEKYFSSGNINIATNLSKAMEGVINTLGELDNPELTGAVSDILEDATWTREGIDEAIAQIEKLDDSKGIVTALNKVKELLLTNIPLTIQTAIEGVATSAEESVEAINKAYKGFTKIADAREFLQTINDSLDEDEEKYTINDLDWDGKKYTPTKELIEKYITLKKENITDAITDVDDLIEQEVLSHTKLNSAEVYTNVAKYADKSGYIPIGTGFASEDDEYLFNALRTAGLINVDEDKNRFTLSDTLSQAIEVSQKAGEKFNILQFVADYLKEQSGELDSYLEYYDKVTEQLKKEELATALNNFQSIANYLTSGFDSLTAIKTYAEELKLDLDSDDYSYSKDLHKWFLTVEGVRKIKYQLIKDITDNGGTWEEVSAAFDQLSQSLLENIDINSYLSSNKTAQDEATLRQTYESWYESLQNKTGVLTTEAFMTEIKAGGERAIAVAESMAQRSGKKMSTSDVEDVYRSEATKKLIEIGEYLDKGIGEVISAKANEILTSSAVGYTTRQIGSDAFVIESLGKVEEAYRLYFEALTNDAKITAAEINEARDNLIEKHNDNRIKNADAISGITDLKPGEWYNITDLLDDIPNIPQEYIKQLQSFGATIENSILITDARTNMAGVIATLRDTAKEMGVLTKEELAILNDTVNEVLDSYADAIQKGIEGGITEAEKLDLERIGNYYNIKVDFTKTAEGLKLSEKSARNLYLALREVDSIRAKLVFDKLAESLEKTNSNYKNISTITAHIAQIEKKLANPKISTARRKEYEKELELAKEIQETRALTDAGDFNYMDRDLPTGMQSPIDYWQGTYSAFEAMNKAGENGYMSIKDFYNIVNEMNNMAKEMGKTVIFMGETLDGSTTSASKLIQKGMHAIANIDDVGPAISLERFGNEFKNGASDMQSGIEAGTKTMAESQIEMLDAMIAFLEVVVAMENFEGLDKNENGLEVEELFKPLTNGMMVATDDAAEAAKKVLDLAKTNKDLDRGLKTVVIDGKSVQQRMEELRDHIEVTADDAWKTTKAYGALLEAARSGDFSNKNISQLLVEAFKGVKEATEVQVGDRKFVIKGDVVIEADNNGWYTVDGVRTKDIKKALAAKELQDVEGALNIKDTHSSTTGEKFVVGEIPIDTQTNVIVKENIETGEKTYTYTDSKGEKHTIKDRDKAIHEALKIGFDKYNNAHSDKSELENKIDYYAENDIVAKYHMTISEIEADIGTSLDNLTDEQLKKLLGENFDAALVMNIEIAIRNALRNVNLGELILDGLLGSGESDTSLDANTDLNKLKNNSKLVELGRQLGVGIITAIQDGIVEANKTGTEENPGSAITDELTSGMEQGQEDVESTANELAKALASPFVKLVGGEGESDSLMKQYGLDAIRSFIDGFTLVSNGESAFAETFGTTIGGQITAPIKTALEELFTKETLDQLVKDFETNSTIALSFDSIDVGKLTEASNAVSEAIDTAATALNKLSASLSKLPDKSTEVNSTANALNNLHSHSIQVKANMHVDVSGASTSWWDSGWQTLAKGNTQLDGMALAGGRGKKTLMGELGPELVVSGGRYYVVGQNGAEMVDLPNDAIVFNHIQTRQLLANGSSGRGQAVTNEYNAVAHAAGTAGPAMASAKDTLELLKQIRAMWQAMLTASSKQLGALAGKSKAEAKDAGKDDEVEVVDENGNISSIKRTTADIQRWYNLVRQIDKVEKDIAYQESLINLYQADRIVNGEKMYANDKERLKLLESNIEREQQLVTLQKDWYDKKRAELAASAYGKIFTYTEDGLQQYVDGRGRGLDILEKLNEQTVYGEGINNAASVQAQLDYLSSIGFDINELKYGNDQNIQYVGSSGYIVDINGNVLEGEDLINAQASLMETFWSKVDGWRDELDDLYDTYREYQQKQIDAQVEANKILQKWTDNQIEVENTVLDAIVNAREREIDELQKNRDAYEESTNKMINGLNKALSEERKMYQNQQDKDDLTKMQRQLAILQRSGGSASQIKALQDQISAKQQEMYFNEREQQIQDIQDAADKQIQQLDEQIDLMTETLEYQKEHGILWNEVYNVMSEEASEIIDFITANGADWESISATDKAEQIRVLLEKIQQWTEYRDDEDVQQLADKIVNSTVDTIENNYSNTTSASQYTTTNNSGLEKQVEEYKVYLGGEDSNNSSSTNSKNTTSSNKVAKEDSSERNKEMSAVFTEGFTRTYARSGNTFKETNTKIGHTGEPVTVIESNVGYKGNNAISLVEYNGKQYYMMDKRLRYNEGGPLPVNYTGPIWFDGTSSNPEYVFTNKQLNKLKDIKQKWDETLCLDNWAKEMSILHTIWQQAQNYSSNNDTSTIGENIYIEQVDVNMNIERMNDSYDARQASRDMVAELMYIARKSGGYNGISRR